MKHLLFDAREWSVGKFPYFRLALLIVFAYIWVRHLADAEFQSIFKGLNLGIHELGHFVFAPFGRFFMVAGGTILQCAAPVISAIMFVRKRDYFAIAVCSGWLSTNFYDVAVYAADARALVLPLVSPFGGDAEHDWRYLLTELGLLNSDKTVAALFRVGAFAAMAFCLVFGAWLVYIMFKTFNPKNLGAVDS